MCAECSVPLCCMGNGRVTCNCFIKAHETKEIVAMVLKEASTDANEKSTLKQKIKNI
jgi:hypothetical protein